MRFATAWSGLPLGIAAVVMTSQAGSIAVGQGADPPSPALVGTPVTLDAAGTTDSDKHALTSTWFFYPEAGTGIPGKPVVARQRPPAGAASAAGRGGTPSARVSGPRELEPRVAIENANSPRAIVLPNVAGIAHVILAVEDHGTPSLTAYRRIILNVKPTPSGGPVPRPVELTAEQDHARMMGLLGKNDLGTTDFPPIETGLVTGDIAFRQHRGGHTADPNWPTFIEFAGRYLASPAPRTP